MLERELKARVPDPDALRDRLLALGALRGFAGMMVDVRWDRNGELMARDEVLRVRTFHHPNGEERTFLAWKGRTGMSSGGLKERRELEYQISPRPGPLLEALGYFPVYTIERFVEYYQWGTTEARLEWYPRMDTLIEVEGEMEGIEGVIRASGLPREAFTADSLAAFSARFAARTGMPAVMTRAELGSEAPSWEAG